MDKIYSHIDALFLESNIYAFLRLMFLVISLAGLMYSVYAPVEQLYILALLSLGFQILAWILGIKFKRIRTIAHELLKINMLYKAYGCIPSSFDLSYLIARISPFAKFCLYIKRKIEKLYAVTIGCLINKIFNKKDKGYEEYLIKDNTSPRKILISMIHENSYWNHNQYKSIFIIGSIFMFFILMFSVFSLLYIIPKIKSGMDYSMLRVVFVFLSFTIVYEIIDKIIQYYESSKVMLEIDNEITRNIGNNEINVLDIFDKYIKYIEKTPSIPFLIYKLNRKRLNEGWKLRVFSENIPNEAKA